MSLDATKPVSSVTYNGTPLRIAADSTVEYVETKTVYLGSNVLGAATLGANWSVANDVYTHTTGSTEDLTFATSAEDGEIYLLEFDTSFTNDEFVRVGIGDQYRVLCYNGKSHIIVPLLASGGSTLYVTPIASTYAGSISNIALRKIQDTGEERVLELYSTTTDNHTKNFGFWNTLIGRSTAENAVGATRSIAIGCYSLQALQGGHRNIGVGTFAMSQMLGGDENISIGADSMIYVQRAKSCVAIGMGCMSRGDGLENNVAIGKYALSGQDDSTSSKNVAIGYNAGYYCKGASNTMLGVKAGYGVETGSQNVLIGTDAVGAKTGMGNTGIGAFASYVDGVNCSTAIGYKAKATKRNQVVVGKHDGGWGDTTETLLHGQIKICDTEGVTRTLEEVIRNTLPIYNGEVV